MITRTARTEDHKAKARWAINLLTGHSMVRMTGPMTGPMTGQLARVASRAVVGGAVADAAVGAAKVQRVAARRSVPVYLHKAGASQTLVAHRATSRRHEHRPRVAKLDLMIGQPDRTDEVRPAGGRPRNPRHHRGLPAARPQVRQPKSPPSPRFVFFTQADASSGRAKNAAWVPPTNSLRILHAAQQLVNHRTEHSVTPPHPSVGVGLLVGASPMTEPHRG